jgi:hypothetical protein
LASSTERSEDERALPRPELNPLLNPLLADNMGRWAEVYFTSPPEKREEAVVELLRELEARRSDVESHTASAQVVHEVSTHAPSTALHRAATGRQPSYPRHCDTCGHDNPLMHQFCGMCGAQFGGTALEDPKIDSAYDPQGAGNNRADAPSHAESSTDYREPIEKGLQPAEEPRRDPYDLSPFQSLLEREDGAASGDESPPGRYRYYIGAILAILILVLGYAAWNSSRSDQNAHGAPPAAPPAATDTAPAAPSPNPSGSAPSKPAEQQPTRAAKSAPRPSPPKPTESPKQLETVANGMNAPAATPASQSAVDSVERVSFQGNGAEEFATAQRFLRGSSGQVRDTAEASKWLWKSIGKHNGPALLELADLYLKGDGVSKNCDQARVLLDSAARRGMAGAGERLRNLPAFGCQ